MQVSKLQISDPCHTQYGKSTACVKVNLPIGGAAESRYSYRMKKKPDLQAELIAFLKNKKVSMAKFAKDSGVNYETIRNIKRFNTIPEGEDYIAVRRILQNIAPVETANYELLSALGTLVYTLERERIMPPGALRNAFIGICDRFAARNNHNGQAIAESLIDAVDSAHSSDALDRIIGGS